MRPLQYTLYGLGTFEFAVSPFTGITRPDYIIFYLVYPVTVWQVCQGVGAADCGNATGNAKKTLDRWPQHLAHVVVDHLFGLLIGLFRSIDYNKAELESLCLYNIDIQDL